MQNLRSAVKRLNFCQQRRETLKNGARSHLVGVHLLADGWTQESPVADCSGRVSRMARHYTHNHREIEADWTVFQGRTASDAKSHQKQTALHSKEAGLPPQPAANSGRGFYCLGQFPYPSGNIHLGHYRVYSIADSIYRYEMLRGSDVISPVGWDSFGLPAENAARDRNIHPGEWTESNIQEMKQDLIKTGLVLEFDKEIATHRPDYYKWTQWIFIKLFEQGLVYQKESWVNWDPIDNTVLANEQVDSKGLSWRSGAIVERIKLKQWYFKITAYGDQLDQDLNTLSGWPDSVKELQKGWIGKSRGHTIKFRVKGFPETAGGIECFTTRIDTLPGVKFIAVNPHHEIMSQLNLSSNQLLEVAALQEHVSKSRESNLKEGKSCQAVYLGTCYHPQSNKEIPIYAADYVLSDYGTGAVMGVPAHDERDKRLALKVGIVFSDPEDCNILTEEQVNSVVGEGKSRGFIKESQMFALRDWLISRQRYWGAPIPIIYCQNCGTLPVPEGDLPVLLPEITSTTQFYAKGADGKTSNPLERESFKNCRCPKCGGPAQREADTMDTFVDSSWYFMRFLDHKNEERIFDREKADAFLPIKAYIGGMEHAIKHLLYARFVFKALRDRQLVGSAEPFENIITQGLVMGKSFRSKSTGKYLTREQAAGVPPGELEVAVEKMSKSKLNGISPLAAVDTHGKDCVKLALALAGPVEKDIVVEDSMMANTSSLLDRMEAFLLSLPWSQLPEDGDLPNLEKIIREYDAGFQYKRVALHVSAARVIELFNGLKKAQTKLGKNEVRLFLWLLYPFAPHFAEYFWRRLQPSSPLMRELGEDSLRKCFAAVLGTPYTAGYGYLQSTSTGQGQSTPATWTLLLNQKPVAKLAIPAELAEHSGDFAVLKEYLVSLQLLEGKDEILSVNKNPKRKMLIVNSKSGKQKK